MKFFSKIKYPALKVIDISGLAFLAPVVRLCYGEEPQVQLKKIVQWIVIPLIAIIAGRVIYDTVASKVETKSGSLPVFSQIVDSYQSIDNLHEQEKLKSEAYELSGDERQKKVEEVSALLAGMDAEIAVADKKVAEEEVKKEGQMKSLLLNLNTKYEQLQADIREFSKSRKEREKIMSEALKPGDKAQYDTFLVYIRETRDILKVKTEEKNNLRKEKSKLESTTFPQYIEAKKMQTAAVEKKAFYETYMKLLTETNKDFVLNEKGEAIKVLKDEYYALSGVAAYSNAKSIVREEIGVEKKIESSYAGSKTIWFQVQRSVICVFLGFFIGSIIAIPIGILCGLNKTFMAAMTPFIAVFKPVSPIVWLPIVLIVVSGFFPDPDTHPVMTFLWDLPLLGQYKLNPAFMASAITVALCSLWATMANTALGVASIDKDHMNVARVLKLGFTARLCKIIIPSSLPLIFAGLRISLGVGWMVLIAAELLSTSEGIGKFVIDEFNNGSSDSLAKMMVIVFIVGFIGLLLDRIMVIFQRLVSFEGSAATV